MSKRLKLAVSVAIDHALDEISRAAELEISDFVSMTKIVTRDDKGRSALLVVGSKDSVRSAYDHLLEG